MLSLKKKETMVIKVGYMTEESLLKYHARLPSYRIGDTASETMRLDYVARVLQQKSQSP